MKDHLVGTCAGGYKLGSRLGEGGMGVVYKGIHEILGTEAAIKLLPAHLSRKEEYRQRFFREAKSAMVLRHPNIVAVLDAGWPAIPAI